MYSYAGYVEIMNIRQNQISCSGNNIWIIMVEILLEFIRAERSSNWMLHLEFFAAMLSWLTIYHHTHYARWGPVYLTDMSRFRSASSCIYDKLLVGNFVV